MRIEAGAELMSIKVAAAALLALTIGGAPAVAADPSRYMTAELVAETPGPAPGSTILVGIRMVPKPGWHGYWSTPGDIGIAPTVSWTAPEGVSFGPLLHPAPTLLTANGLSSFVHDGPHVLLSRMRVSSSVARGTAMPISADLRWAACTATQCVPLHATLTLQLTAGVGSKGEHSAELHAAVRKLPRAAEPGAFVRDGKSIRLLVPAALKLDPRTTRFYPAESGVFDTASARSELRAGTLTISASAKGGGLAPIHGVLSDGKTSHEMTFVPQPNAAEPHTTIEAKSPPEAAKQKPAPTAAQVRKSAPLSSSGDGSRSTLPWVALGAAAIAAAGLLLAGRRSRRG